MNGYLSVAMKTKKQTEHCSAKIARKARIRQICGLVNELIRCLGSWTFPSSWGGVSAASRKFRRSPP